MDLFSAIKERRSCRDFLPDPIDQEILEKLMEAASWAPSPLNMQPWQFVVITKQQVKDKIHEEAERCRQWAIEKSGWKWLGGYETGFLKSAPVMIAVTGDPAKTGVDKFLDEGGVGYQHACAAAVQNMLLAAHAMGIGSLWFTFFDKQAIRDILDIGEEKTLIALICLGKSAGEPAAVPRKGVKEKTVYIR